MRCPYGRVLDPDSQPWQCPLPADCHCVKGLLIYAALGDLTPEIATIVNFWQERHRGAPNGAFDYSLPPLPSGNGDGPVHIHH